ncbi:hypothetical protein DFLDMN_000271 [Cupriavidus sp. H19C3]
MTDAHMARVFLAQARAARRHPAWHAKLLSWAAARRRRYAALRRTGLPAQYDLFDDRFTG